MGVDRGALNAGLMAQIQEAQARASAAERKREEAKVRRFQVEEQASKLKTEADGLAGEADSWQTKGKARQTEAEGFQKEYESANTNLGYYKSRYADLQGLNKNLDTQTAGKISELEGAQGQYAIADVSSGSSDFAPPSSFNEVPTSFGALRDKVREGFAGRAAMDRPNAGQVLDRNQFLNRRT